MSYKNTLLAAVLLVTANASEQQNVTIESVVKHTNSDHQPIYAVKYSYSFPPDETVEIEGIGRVRSSGSMEYYTKGTAVKIVHGGTTESFPLTVTGETAGANDVDIPSASLFSSFGLTRSWHGDEPIMETALPPMEKWFPQGHEPGATDDFRTFYYISSFRSLDNLPDEVRGKAAVEILFPPQPAKTGSEINVRLLILETRSHSGKWIAPITPEVNKSAQVLLDNFMADLDAEAKKR